MPDGMDSSIPAFRMRFFFVKSETSSVLTAIGDSVETFVVSVKVKHKTSAFDRTKLPDV